MTSTTDNAQQLGQTFSAIDAHLPWARIDKQPVAASVLRRYLQSCRDNDVVPSLGGLANFVAASDQ